MHMDIQIQSVPMLHIDPIKSHVPWTHGRKFYG